MMTERATKHRVRLQTRPLPILLTAVTLLAACDAGVRSGKVESDSTLAAAASDTSGRASNMTAPPVGTREVLVALSGEGLQFVDAGTGRTRLVPFGWAWTITVVVSACWVPRTR